MLSRGTFQDISVLGTPTVIRHGLLGMQEAGKLVQKYFVVYKGRMEFYSSVEEAKSAAVPAAGTFWLEELSKIDHVGSGVVMSFEGKYVGLHADSEASSLEWARAIRTASLFGAAAEELQASKEDTAAKQSASQRTSLRRSIAELSDSTGASRQAASLARCANLSSETAVSAPPSQGAAEMNDALSTTSKKKEQTVEPSTKQFACFMKPEVREGGFGWANREIAENIVQHEERHPPERRVAEKVGVAPRSNIVRRRESFGQAKWEKISSKGDQAKTSGSFRLSPPKKEVVPAMPNAISPWTVPKRAVSGKVTDAVTQFGQSWHKTSALQLRPKTKPWETASKVQSVEASRTMLDKGQHKLLAAQPAAGAPSGQPAHM
mmetsp:Transcript_68938/g.128727  ORF Transcript_68938/g.128727 Transcript_68938/m.128727 type:complete len:377 (+) Transcript_68938:3-1133(+)